MEWISVKDRLPDESQERILIYHKDSISLVSHAVAYGSEHYFNEGHWSYSLKDVSHWMPLPDKPEDIE